MIDKEDCVKIGEIGKTHGLQGAVVVYTDNDLLEVVFCSFFVNVQDNVAPFEGFFHRCCEQALRLLLMQHVK